MITRMTGYTSSDGEMHATLAEAQFEELKILGLSATGFDVDDADRSAQFIVDNADKILDILSTTPTSKPKARSINGGKKVRKPKATTEATLFKDSEAKPAA